MNERNKSNTTEGLVAITSEVCGRNENDVPATSTSVVDSTPVVPKAETTETETQSPRTFLPSRSPSRPTATATCRLRMWVQRISEGQINEPTQDETHSIESGGTETSIIVEEIPEELGHEWRVLHPFEIPGVRFPTDATPPNQRRLAENDALVELVQTTEYLEDRPMWGQRDYRLYPPRYGDPFYRGIGRVRGRGRGRHEWFNGRPVERSNGGLGRGFSHGNGRKIREETSQVNIERNQQDRQEEEWSVPTSIERREEDPIRCELQRAPPVSPPS